MRGVASRPGVYQQALIPAVAPPEAPRATGRAVPAGDVAESPADLRRWVRAPVRTCAGHLRSGQRLRNPIGTRARVVGGDAPPTLVIPHSVQAAELATAPSPGG